MFAVEVLFKARVKDIKPSEAIDPGLLTKSTITGALEHIVEQWGKEVEDFTISVIGNGNGLMFNYIFETDVKEEMEEFRKRVYDIDVQGVHCASVTDIYPNSRYVSVISDILSKDEVEELSNTQLYDLLKDKFGLFFDNYPPDISFCFISGGVDTIEDVIRNPEYLLCIDFGVYNKTPKEIETISYELEEASFVISANSRRGIPKMKTVS